MTAKILIVDDVPANVKFLEVRLLEEYYEVSSASNGAECLEEVVKFNPDVILLDVMMPIMDGFEACKRLKSNPETSHIPVVIVTALDDVSDKVRGLESGADDFLTKPINDTALFFRIKSLVRIKSMIDELRMRYYTSQQLGALARSAIIYSNDIESAVILLITDDWAQSMNIKNHLGDKFSKVEVCDNPGKATEIIKDFCPDLILLDMDLSGEYDCFRICAQMRNNANTRYTPVIILFDESDLDLALKRSEIAGNEYILVPIDRSELLARVASQIKRKKYHDALRNSMENDIELSLIDSLTGCYNRRYFEAHLVNELSSNNSCLGLLMIDVDFFKKINDSLGHQVGDEVLSKVASIISDSIRASDLLARYGGEEFVCIASAQNEHMGLLAERIRENVAKEAFCINEKEVKVTVSIGIGCISDKIITASDLIGAADKNLYEAKNRGRNMVYQG